MWISFSIAGLMLLVVGVIGLYNNLRTRKNQIAFAEGSVDAYLKKRHDLVPSLAEVVKGYAEHEKEVFAGVAKSRETVMQIARAGSLSKHRAQAENQFVQGLGHLLALSEAYPALHASHHFMRLQRSLFELEEHIAASRRFFNAAVNDYNNAVETFPSNLVAGWMGYKRLPYFEISELEKVVPHLSLS